METLAVLLGMVVCIAVIGAIMGAFYGLIHFFLASSKQLRGHYLTALAWTLLVGGQTAYLLRIDHLATADAYLLLIGAGTVLIPCWAQWWERRRGGTVAQQRRPLLARLYTQTLWGPLALCIAVIFINVFGQFCFEQALQRQDLSAAKHLRAWGIGNPDVWALRVGLTTAIETQDRIAVCTYLGMGVPKYWMYEAIDHALQKDSTEITETLLQYAGPVDYTAELLRAVEYRKVSQVRLLLRYGADRTQPDYNGITPLKYAQSHGDWEMVKALREPTNGKGTNH